MITPYLDLIGVCLDHDIGTSYYVQTNVFRERVNGAWGDLVVQNSYSLPIQGTFTEITSKIQESYTPVLLNIWKNETGGRERQYLQFKKTARPSAVGLGAGWTLWAIR